MERFFTWYAKHPVSNFWLSFVLVVVVSLMLDKLVGA